MSMMMMLSGAEQHPFGIRVVDLLAQQGWDDVRSYSLLCTKTDALLNCHDGLYLKKQ